MILINLLPHREAARKRRRETFNLLMGVAALIGGLVAGSIFLWYQAQLSDQQQKVTLLQTENKKLDEKIKDSAGLRSDIAALRARQTLRIIHNACPDRRTRSWCCRDWSGPDWSNARPVLRP